MANLARDAVCTIGTPTSINNIATRVTPAVLQEMLKINDLDEREIISLVFLMVDQDTDFHKVLEEVKEDPRAAFIRRILIHNFIRRILIHNNLWAEKLIESLIIIKNKHVLKKMGFDKNEVELLENSFVAKQHNVSPYLNKAIKSLYFLCESLNKNETKQLIDEVNNKLGKSSDVNPDNIYLELYILEWLQEKYICVNPDKFDLSNLLKSLKIIGCSTNLPFDFDDWEIKNPVTNRNHQDSQMCQQIPEINSNFQYQSSNYSSFNTDADIKWSSPDHLRLLIIINQTEFTDKKKFESRTKGSMEDEQNLERTFNSCGFKIKKHRNFKKYEMIELLDSLNSNFYSKYGAIFMCILSHGFKGEVVFADDEFISIDAIKEKFCCPKLKNVFKFLILQSCQGENIGRVEKQLVKLVTDGPSNSINPLYRMHFCLFHATVSDFAAIRDEEKGSWFIQDLCKEIQEANGHIEISYLMRKVKLAVSSRRGRLRGYYFEDAVQVPEVSGDTIVHPYFLTKVSEPSDQIM